MKRKMNSRVIVMSMIIFLGIGISASARADDFPSVGFYLNNPNGENIYFDIYTFLNNKEDCMSKINEVQLKNVIFIHQSGQGNTLEGILNNDSLKDLKRLAFKDIYIDITTKEEIYTGLGELRVIDIY